MYEGSVWVYGAERTILGRNIHLGQQVERTTFTDVGHPKKSHLERSAWPAKSDFFDWWGTLNRNFSCFGLTEQIFKHV